ncbi:hypothetical protein HG531_001421 [Fusarium graminearum]|nr:hypothetical protein HG531_001421 [Fusarium graminearum]
MCLIHTNQSDSALDILHHANESFIVEALGGAVQEAQLTLAEIFVDIFGKDNKGVVSVQNSADGGFLLMSKGFSLSLTKLTIGCADGAMPSLFDGNIVVLVAPAVLSRGLFDQIRFFDTVEYEVIFIHIVKERVPRVEVFIGDTHCAVSNREERTVE